MTVDARSSGETTVSTLTAHADGVRLLRERLTEAAQGGGEQAATVLAICDLST